MNIEAFPSGRAEVRGSVVRIQDTAFFVIFFESAIYFIAPRLGGSLLAASSRLIRNPGARLSHKDWRKHACK